MNLLLDWKCSLSEKKIKNPDTAKTWQACFKFEIWMQNFFLKCDGQTALNESSFDTNKNIIVFATVLVKTVKTKKKLKIKDKDKIF